MKALINQNRFLKAVEYVSENHFSKPYSITPIIERWFNQLSMIQFADGQIVHLNEKVARKHVDITLDGKVVDPQDIRLVIKFKAKNSEAEKQGLELAAKIAELTAQLNYASDSAETEQKQQELLVKKTELETFNADKIKADALYNDIVERGQSSLNEASIEAAYNSKIKNIVHRPNHGLTHSTRAGYLITALHAYATEHGVAYKNLNESELEKLQLMMLFSVVGRKDETGFNDTGTNALGRATYQSFRSTSGREYLKYFQNTEKQIYGSNMELLYRDAVVVELMGYSSIADAIDGMGKAKKIPEVLIDYVIAKEHSLGRVVDKDAAINLIAANKYGLSLLFPTGGIRALADNKLNMMNQSHALDLTRCYPLFATSEGGAKSIGILHYHLQQIKFFNFDKPDAAKFTSFFKLMRCGFDTLELTGQRSTFGLLSAQEFEAQKEDILKEIKNTSTAHKHAPRANILLEANLIIKEIEGYFGVKERTDDQLIADFRVYSILKVIATRLSAAERLMPTKEVFAFQHSTEGNPHFVDHHKNGLSLVQAMQTVTPVKGIEPVKLPIITSVKHNRSAGEVTTFFDDKQQAEYFRDSYSGMFGVIPNITTNSQNQYVLVIDRKNYKQLVDDRLVEFKLVSIPAEVKRESTLVDEDGGIDALNLVAHSRALVRLVSTSALGGETFPDYDYLLRAFEDPVHERYSPPQKELTNFPLLHDKYYDPRNGDSYARKRAATQFTDLRFQEPVYEPDSFADKIADGWVLGAKSREHNTIYAKKMSHTLLPPHGKVIPFNGVLGRQNNYFPIGVLSDVSQVDLKDGRYIWSQNMETVNRFWIRDTSYYDKGIYKYLNARLDDKDVLQRYPATVNNAVGVIALDKSRIKTLSSPETLVKYLEQRSVRILQKIDAKQYRPQERVIQDCIMLLKQERKEYLEQARGDKTAQKRITQIYKALVNRFKNEAERTHPKYGISLRELIEQQKKSQVADKHNEILAGNTKKATRAFYASKDALFDRLNLAFHAQRIKSIYHYDVPLLVMSEGNSPYFYNEALIKADLQQAYKLLREGNFPYDKTLSTVFEVDSNGKIVKDIKGAPQAKRDAEGKEIQEPRNLQFQTDLLVDLFKLGMPDLETIEQLAQGQIDKTSLDGEKIDSAIESIIDEMDFIGGLKRENQLMIDVFAKDDVFAREKFFLRAASLGHLKLIEEMLTRDDFKLSGPLLDKAIKFAEKNKHQTVIDRLDHLPCIDEKRALEQMLSELKQPVDLTLTGAERLSAYEDRMATTFELYDRCEVLSGKFILPELKKSIQEQAGDIFLNSPSQNETNQKVLPEFIKLLKANPQYVEAYSCILSAHKMVKLDQLLEAHRRHGAAHVIKAMSTIVTDGWQKANDYLVLVELNALDKANEYLNTTGSISTDRLDSIAKECLNYIKQIKAQSLGPDDLQTRNYCEGMIEAVKNNKGNFVALSFNLAQLKETHQAVYSSEMMAIKAQVKRFEQNAQSFFGTWGNQDKANRIISSASKVSLKDRAHIFSDENNSACNEVRKALASHRMSFTNPVKNGKVISSEAATSFKEVQKIADENKAFKEKYKAFYETEEELQHGSSTTKEFS